MSYNKVKAIAEHKEVVTLESIKNGTKITRSLPFKDVPMFLVVKGQNKTVSINEVIDLLYNEIEQLKNEIASLRYDTLDKIKRVAEQVDKITNHINQEGSVVGW
jgi:protein-tyrosine phosphatase